MSVVTLPCCRRLGLRPAETALRSTHNRPLLSGGNSHQPSNPPTTNDDNQTPRGPNPPTTATPPLQNRQNDQAQRWYDISLLLAFPRARTSGIGGSWCLGGNPSTNRDTQQLSRPRAASRERRTSARPPLSAASSCPHPSPRSSALSTTYLPPSVHSSIHQFSSSFSSNKIHTGPFHPHSQGRRGHHHPWLAQGS